MPGKDDLREHSERDRARNAKAKERGLTSKHWAEHRAAKLATAKAHEAQMAEAEAEEKQVAESVTAVQTGRKLPRQNALKVEKIRRSQRRHARDAKCFDTTEPSEVFGEEKAKLSVQPLSSPTPQASKQVCARPADH